MHDFLDVQDEREICKSTNLVCGSQTSKEVVSISNPKKTSHDSSSSAIGKLRQ